MRIWRSIFIALVCVFASALLALALKPVLHDQALLLPFTLAVVAASSYGGLAPGILATGLSFVIGDFFFTEPLFKVLSVYPDDFAVFAVFLVFGVTLSLVNHTRLRANGALVRSHRQLKHAAAELTRANAELRDFAHTVAHDLREPLRAVQTMIEMFLASEESRSLSSRSAGMLNLAVAGSDRMRSLIDSMLEFAEAGEAGSAKAGVDTRAAAQLAVEQLHHAREKAGARISIGSLPVVHGHEAQITRLFQNLFGNAIKYRTEERTLEISATAVHAGHEWIFSVQDNGVGIDPEDHKRVFEPFQRSRGAARREGIGIGLATCARIVANHGGRIWVESQPGAGSTFHFTIPVDQPAAAGEAPPPRKSGSPEQLPEQGQRAAAG